MARVKWCQDCSVIVRHKKADDEVAAISIRIVELGPSKIHSSINQTRAGVIYTLKAINMHNNTLKYIAIFGMKATWQL